MKNKIRVGIYPGSFDPITFGHIDIINRAKLLCDKLIIAVAVNIDKKPLFTVQERLDSIKSCFSDEDNISLVSFDGLLTDYCKENGVSIIFRGLRAIVDFEYETAIALMNKRLAPEVETIFMVASQDYSFVSSRIVKEVASYGGDVTSLVPQHVLPMLSSKFLKS